MCAEDRRWCPALARIAAGAPPALVLLGIAAAFGGCAGSGSPREGTYRAWLDSPGGELPFGLEIAVEAGSPRAWLVNGPERIEVERVALDGGRLALDITRYDAAIHARTSAGGRRLDGEWRRRSGGEDAWARLVFHATHGDAPRFPAGAGPSGAAGVAGRWAVDFESDDLPAVAVFEAGPAGMVTGTFLTATGDYRYLAGVQDGDRLRLSCFDGSHAFLFEARLLDPDRLEGDFWSRESWHERWTARRDPAAEPPDPFAQTFWIEGTDLGSLVFPDLEGRPRSLADPAFAGKARIIELFGSWCPNCNDATRYLVDLDRRYRARGLSILGLAFEHTGDFARDAAQARTYAAYHAVDYPILLGGLSDKGEASEAFAAVDRVRAFPTTIFLRGDGRVRAVHSGFSGPATGPAHDHLRERFESLIEEMLGAP